MATPGIEAGQRPRLAMFEHLLKQGRQAPAQLGQRGLAALMPSLGWYGRAAVPPAPFWLHLGEGAQWPVAMALVAALRSERPAMPMLITHAGGETGSAAWHHSNGASSNGASSDRSQSDWAQRPPWRAGDREVWAPLDLNGAARRFVGHFAPAVGVLLGMAWPPTLLQQARRAGVAMLLAQGRIDDCSGPRARLSAQLRALGLQQLAAVLVSSAYEQRQFQTAGAARVQLVGNPAFDATPPARQVARGLQWRQRLSRPALVAMGTDAASEAQLLRRWKAMPGPRALLVLVPQDPQRSDELVRQWRAAGWRVARRSRWASHPGEADLQADLWLADLAGEAATLYAMADAAMLASSFSTDAGQQPMLAVACGCPLVIGSSVIRALVKDPVGQTAPAGGQADPWSELLLATGALRHADSLPQALDMALHMALAPQRNQWVQEGLRFAQTHRDAAHRVVAEALAHARPAGHHGSSMGANGLRPAAAGWPLPDQALDPLYGGRAGRAAQR